MNPKTFSEEMACDSGIHIEIPAVIECSSSGEDVSVNAVVIQRN